MVSKVRSLFRSSDFMNVGRGIHLTVIDFSDANRLAALLNDRAFSDNTCSIPHPYTLADANAFIAAVLEYEKQNKVRRDWVIRNADHELIGGIGLLYSHGLRAHRTELGYWLGKEYWNQGVMTEVLKSFSAYVFANTPMVRLEAHVFKDNQASCRVLEKAGFTKEGYLRKAYLKDDKYLDAWLYALIRNSR
ncbi:MAG: GNAT family N-acetyltransferase [Saprospiraceae bacterium]|nr:GNAT family N-acetyltransferase [Saprospiraceae bacterium]